MFHDGSPFTAADVKYTLERFADPEHAPYATPHAIAFGNFERVDVIDDLTAHVVTKRPEPALEAILSMPQASIFPAENAAALGPVEFGRAPVGTGPYRLSEFLPEERIVLEAFDGFWGTQPNAGRIEFRRIPELASRITALANDEVDIITHVPPDQVAAIDAAPCCDTRSILNNIFHVLYFNSQHPQLQDTQLRQALALAIDRELLVEALWGGRAEVPLGHQFRQYGTDFDATRTIPAYDPERAKALVAASSYDGTPVTLRTSSTYYTNGLLAAQAVAEMWKAVGVNVELLVDATTTSSWEETMVVNWSNPVYFTDPAGAYGVMYAPQGFRGSDRWAGDHAAYEELYDRFRFTLDAAERRALYGELLDFRAENLSFLD